MGVSGGDAMGKERFVIFAGHSQGEEVSSNGMFGGLVDDVVVFIFIFL